MPAMVLTAAYVAVNGVDISGYCKKVELTTNVEKKDVTTFAASGWKTLLGGLKSGMLATTLINDMLDNDLDEDIWTLYLAGTPVSFEVRAANSAVGVSNPKYTGNVLVDQWKPISGGVGDVNEAGYTWDTSGAVTRATA